MVDFGFSFESKLGYESDLDVHHDEEQIQAQLEAIARDEEYPYLTGWITVGVKLYSARFYGCDPTDIENYDVTTVENGVAYGYPDPVQTVLNGNANTEFSFTKFGWTPPSKVTKSRYFNHTDTENTISPFGVVKLDMTNSFEFVPTNSAQRVIGGADEDGFASEPFGFKLTEFDTQADFIPLAVEQQ